MTLVAHVPIVAADVKPYVESHLIGRVWFSLAAVVAVLELVGASRHRAEATKHDQGSQYVLRACVLVAIVVLVLAIAHVPGAEIRPPLLSVVVGIVLFAAGEAIRVWSRRTLGRYFTYTVQTSGDQPVITGGPYRFVRHPSYTGVVLLATGAGFVEGNWIGVAALAVMTFVGLRYRIHVEERALLEELGDRYRAFAEHRKRLIPFVW